MFAHLSSPNNIVRILQFSSAIFVCRLFLSSKEMRAKLSSRPLAKPKSVNSFGFESNQNDVFSSPFFYSLTQTLFTLAFCSRTNFTSLRSLSFHFLSLALTLTRSFRNCLNTKLLFRSPFLKFFFFSFARIWPFLRLVTVVGWRNDVILKTVSTLIKSSDIKVFSVSPNCFSSLAFRSTKWNVVFDSREFVCLWGEEKSQRHDRTNIPTENPSKL